MAKRNPFDETTISVLTEIKQYRDRAVKAKVIPLGTEKVDARTARTRLAQMSPEERLRMIDEIGMSAIVEQLGG